MRAATRLILRGMRWRLGISLLTILTSAIAVGAAVVGPLYLRAAGDSVLRTTVSAAPIQARGLTLSTVSGHPATLGAVQAAARRLTPGTYGPPVVTAVSGLGLTSRHTGPVRSQLLARSGICRVLRFLAGGCPTAAGQVAVSQRSARDLRVGLGGGLAAGVQGSARRLELTVVGVYAVPDVGLAYWWGGGPGDFPFGQSTNVGSATEPEIDSLIASPATALAVPARDAPVVTAQLPLKPGAVGLAGEARLRAELASARRLASADGLQATSGLGDLLDGADGERHAMATIVALAAVQLVVLAIWVLAALLLRSVDARRSEARVAQLRGFTAGGLLSVIALEPAVLCVVGAGVGIAGAWLAVAAARHELLDPRTTISVDGWTLIAFGATVVAITLVLAFATARLLRGADRGETVLHAGARRELIADAVLLVLSAVALVALATNGSLSGHGNPIASAAPGLIALGIAVLAVRLVLAAGRMGISASAESSRIALFLATRRIVRQPRLMRQTRALIIALGLACFAVAAWAESRANRSAAATFSVGTREVVQVTPRGTGLQRAVDAVDPHGRYAMAAVLVATSSSTLLGVDSRRLAATAFWPAGISRASVTEAARRLRPPTPPAIELAEPSVLLTATTSASRRGALGKLELGLWVVNPVDGTSIVDLGRLRAGTAVYRASLAGQCPGGCRVAGVGLLPAPDTHPAPGITRVSLTGLTTAPADRPSGARPLPADLFPGGWYASSPGVRLKLGRHGPLQIIVSPAALAADAGAAPGVTPPMAAPSDHPATLPGAVTQEVVAVNAAGSTSATIPAQGIDGQTLAVHPAVVASALPGLGADAVMVDLDLLTRSQIDATLRATSDEVWLGPATPPDTLSRLAHAGLRIDRVQRAAEQFTALQRGGPALADDFLLLAALAALLAAGTSTLATLGANPRGRAAELTALEVSGVARRTLAGSLILEAGILAGTALCGAIAGIVSALLAVPALPQTSGTDLAPLHYPLPVGLLVGVAVATAAVVLAAGAGVGAVLLRRMSPSSLRAVTNDLAA